MANACIKIDGYRYLVDLPDEECVARMHKRFDNEPERPKYLFYAKAYGTSTSGIDLIDYRAVYLTGGLQPAMANVGFASPFAAFTDRVDCNLLPGKNTKDTLFLPMLIPLDKNGYVQPINDQDWSIVRGGTLYLGDKPYPAPATDTPIAASPIGDHAMTISDTVEGLELEWYVVNGFMLARHPVCKCAAKALSKAGIGSVWRKEDRYA